MGGTIWRLRRGRSCLAQAVVSRSGDSLTSNEDVIERWGEHFEELLNPRGMPPLQESEWEASGVSAFISLVEVTKVVKKLLEARLRGWMRYTPEMLKALDIVGLTRLTRLSNFA